jgi:hypothetical protein
MQVPRLNMKLDRKLAFDCLRLLIFFAIVSNYYSDIASHLNYVNTNTLPRSKNCFLYIQPASSNGASYIFDFISFYAGGRLNKERVEKNSLIDLYDPFLFTQAIERVAAPLKPQGTYCLQYPPIIFALITPLAYFDLYTAWRIWAFLIIICISLTYIFIAYDSLKGRPLLLFGLLLCFISQPIYDNVVLGQTTAIEAALVALSFRFLIDKKYFWAGLIAAASLLKLQQALIILIPGFCVGRSKFFRGFLLMFIAEALLSVFIAGYYNVFNFIRANYMSEIAHSFGDMNDIWYYRVFAGMLQSLPWFVSSADKLGGLAYNIVILLSLGLWLKLYPVLRKISGQSIELIGALTTVTLLIFSLHGYLYDYVLYIIPCLWLYIWSTTDDASYNKAQAIIRLIISVVVFYVPFFFWENFFLQIHGESTITASQVRVFAFGIVLASCAAAAIFIEFEKNRNKIIAEVP